MKDALTPALTTVFNVLPASIPIIILARVRVLLLLELLLEVALSILPIIDLLFAACHASCSGGCYDETTLSCDSCKDGWLWDALKGCQGTLILPLSSYSCNDLLP